MKHYALIVAGIIFTSQSSCVLTNQKIHSPLIDLCEVGKSPNDYKGKVVRFDAMAVPTSHYVTAVYSDACDKKKFALAVSEGVEEHQDYVSLRARLYEKYPEQTPHVRARFKARFLWKKNEVPSRILDLIEVENIQEDK